MYVGANTSDRARATGKDKNIKLNHGLITGLVEWWRLETNTFHLNSGEATVTLEDVAYIYSLPIDGLPFNGCTFSSPLTMIKLCDELLGVVPDMNYNCYGVQIKFTWLRESFGLEPKSRLQIKTLGGHMHFYYVSLPVRFLDLFGY